MRQINKEITHWNDEKLWTNVESEEERFFAAIDEDVENDEMSAAEAGFIKGYRKMRPPSQEHRV